MASICVVGQFLIAAGVTVWDECFRSGEDGGFVDTWVPSLGVIQTEGRGRLGSFPDHLFSLTDIEFFCL